MSLSGLQSALAELFTSRAARESYAVNPDAFARRFDLAGRECAQLAALATGPVAAYAASLIGKRRSETQRLLPQAAALLGDDFAASFDAWARDAEFPDGRRRHARDALAFARHLLLTKGESGANIRSVLTGELRALRRSTGRLFRW